MFMPIQQRRDETFMPKKYCIAKTHNLVWNGFNVPYGAIFGTDSHGLYVFSRVNYSPKNVELPLYRYFYGTWVCSIERNMTTEHICEQYLEVARSMRSSFRTADYFKKKQETAYKHAQKRELHLFCKASVPERKPQKYLYQSSPCKALNPNVGIENDRVYDTDYQLITYGCIKNDGTDKNR